MVDSVRLAPESVAKVMVIAGPSASALTGDDPFAASSVGATAVSPGGVRERAAGGPWAWG